MWNTRYPSSVYWSKEFLSSLSINSLVFFIFLSQPLQPFQKRHLLSVVTNYVVYHILESFQCPEQALYNAKPESLQEKKNQLFNYILQS